MRRAVLDAAGALFARRGVENVSLRDIAAEANVQLALISRYVGSRADLVGAVFADLTAKVAQELVDRPLEQLSFERESYVGRWVAMLTHFAMTDQPLPPAVAGINPVAALADVFSAEYGTDTNVARLRAAQAFASGLGWRVFERYLVAWGDLDGLGRDQLLAELLSFHRHIGAIGHPTPPEPPRSRDVTTPGDDAVRPPAPAPPSAGRGRRGR